MKNSKLKKQRSKVQGKIQKFLFLTCTFSFFLLTFTFVFAASPSVRVKDIAHLLEARDNQLMGFGLVAGLKNTGDSVQTEFTKQALTNLLSRMGIAPGEKEFKSRNVAAVMVTAKLPPFVQIGQKIDVTVSSLGDATSLQGGTLLMTPLQGADDNVYAVAQGTIMLGFSGVERAQVPTAEKKQTNAGRIVNGAIVEREVPVSIDENFVSIVIDKPDYTTASRIAIAMKQIGIRARARDAATVIASKEVYQDMVEFIAVLENLTIVPDAVARIVINEQTGVIIMGENVKIAPVAISYGDMNVTVLSATPEATIYDLVSALNAAGVKPKDLVSLLHAIKSSGAISADIEVL
ncbi:MAG: flagellar basal body P-ring protein FlgI [bacterium]